LRQGDVLMVWKLDRLGPDRYAWGNAALEQTQLVLRVIESATVRGRGDLAEGVLRWAMANPDQPKGDARLRQLILLLGELGDARQRRYASWLGRRAG
jgi:hypothetical protein